MATLWPMLEFVKLILDLVAKAVPGIVSRNERDKSAHVGAELFLFYVQLNDALVTAEKIVLLLERYDDELRTAVQSGPETGSDPVHIAYELADLVREQIANIRTTAERLSDVDWQLQVLDGESVAALKFLLHAKMSALDLLSGALSGGRLPLRVRGILIDDGGELPAVPEDPHRVMWSWYDALDTELREGAGHQTLAQRSQQVSEYLAVRKPREDLHRIRDNLEHLRDAIAAQFTIKDILIRVGDPRIERTRYRY